MAESVPGSTGPFVLFLHTWGQCRRKKCTEGALKKNSPWQPIKSNASSTSQDETSELSFCNHLFYHIIVFFSPEENSQYPFWNEIESVTEAPWHVGRLPHQQHLFHSKKVIGSSPLDMISITWSNKHYPKESSEVLFWDALEAFDMIDCHVAKLTTVPYCFAWKAMHQKDLYANICMQAEYKRTPIFVFGMHTNHFVYKVQKKCHSNLYMDAS